MNFDLKMLISLAQEILDSFENAIDAAYVDPYGGKRVIDKINYAWICRFAERFNTVVQMQYGKMQMSTSKAEHIENSVAYHQGQVKRDFETGVLDEDSSKILMRHMSLSICLMFAHLPFLVTTMLNMPMSLVVARKSQ